MLRLLFLFLLIYLGGKIVVNLLKPAKPPVEVHGNSKNKPLDISDDDIEDVDFKENQED